MMIERFRDFFNARFSNLAPHPDRGLFCNNLLFQRTLTLYLLLYKLWYENLLFISPKQKNKYSSKMLIVWLFSPNSLICPGRPDSQMLELPKSMQGRDASQVSYCFSELSTGLRTLHKPSEIFQFPSINCSHRGYKCSELDQRYMKL